MTDSELGQTPYRGQTVEVWRTTAVGLQAIHKTAWGYLAHHGITRRESNGFVDALEQALNLKLGLVVPTVEEVERELGMGSGAWDMVPAEEIIAAVLKLAKVRHES